MSVEIIVAIVSSLAAVLTCIIETRSSHLRMMSELDKQMAVFNTRMEALTEEVKKHNDFAHRIPVLENEIEHLKGTEKHAS